MPKNSPFILLALIRDQRDLMQMPAKKQSAAKQRKKAGDTMERRVATPREDLFVLRLGRS